MAVLSLKRRDQVCWPNQMFAPKEFWGCPGSLPMHQEKKLTEVEAGYLPRTEHLTEVATQVVAYRPASLPWTGWTSLAVAVALLEGEAGDCCCEVADEHVAACQHS